MAKRSFVSLVVFAPFVLLLAGSAAGCKDTLNSGKQGSSCTTQAQCGSGLVCDCSSGTCQPMGSVDPSCALPDAGHPEAGPVDAALPDAATDAAPGDATTSDGAPPDGTVIDGSNSDAQSQDAQAQDGGTTDAAQTDAK